MLKRKSFALLKYIEKYTRTDMVYLATGGFWTTASRVISAVFTFLLAIAFANILPEETFGHYRYVLTLATVAASFSLTGLNLAIIKDVARGAQGLLKIGFKTQLKWSIGTFIATLIMGVYYFTKGNAELMISSLIMGISLPIISSARLYSSFWEGKKDYKKNGIFDLVTTVIYSFFLFITVWFTAYVPAIIFVYYVTQVICAYTFYRWSLKFDSGVADLSHKTLNFGKHLSFLNVLSTIAGQLDKILVFHYLGAAQLATYALSQIPVSLLRSFLKSIAQIAFPKYSEKSLDTIRKSIYWKMLIFTAPIVLIVLLYSILAPFIFKTFFPKYLDAVLYSQVAILSLLFFQKKLIAYTALAHASNKILYSMSIYASLFKIVLLLVLLPLYGIWGAIFSDLIIHAIGLISSLWILKRF
jgi:O-antigen/teichoic acid export membrane protein